MAEIDDFYIKERILKFCEYQMYDADTFDLINFAKSKGFLKDDGTVTSAGLDLANYMNKSDTWIPVEWEIGIPYFRQYWGLLIGLHQKVTDNPYGLTKFTLKLSDEYLIMKNVAEYVYIIPTPPLWTLPVPHKLSDVGHFWVGAVNCTQTVNT